jgi:hypothetical protein
MGKDWSVPWAIPCRAIIGATGKDITAKAARRKGDDAIWPPKWSKSSVYAAGPAERR